MLKWDTNWFEKKKPKRNKPNRTPHKLICEQCGEEYIAYERWKERKYCSKKCSAIARAKKTQKYELKETVCPICGTKFEYKKREGYKDRVYCCRDCASIALGERMKNNENV